MSSSDFAVSAELGCISTYNNYQPVLVWPSMKWRACPSCHTPITRGLLSYWAEAKLGPRDHQYITRILSFFTSLVLNGSRLCHTTS
jgi:hypothetical protein